VPGVAICDPTAVEQEQLHRFGRTVRDGGGGQAIELVGTDEFDQRTDIEYLIGRILDRQEVLDFQPTNNLPESSLNSRKRKPNKPKRAKPQSEHKDGQRSADVARGHKPTGKNKRHRASAGNRQEKTPAAGKPAQRKPAQPKAAQSKPSGTSQQPANRGSRSNTGGNSPAKPGNRRPARGKPGISRG